MARTKQTMHGWLGACFGDSGSVVDKAAAFEELSSAPSPLPGMSGRTHGLTGAIVASGFGDIISTEGDCKVGELALAQLLALNDKLGKPTKYSAAVAALKASYDDAEGSWSRHIPFTPVCGQIKAIGVQADELAKQMAADAGQVIPQGATTQDPTGAFGKATSAITGVAILAAGAFVLHELNKGRK